MIIIIIITARQRSWLYRTLYKL